MMRVELQLPDDVAEALGRFRESEPEDFRVPVDETVILLLREALTGLGLLAHYEPPEGADELH